jgi:hypothetical protein
LIKTLYGLKQSPRKWNEVWQGYLHAQEFKQYVTDPCLYVRNSKNGKIIFGIYVDDILTIIPHTRWSTQERDYYDENNVVVLDWPPQSPELNPFEQVWAFMKQELNTRKTFPKNRPKLIKIKPFLLGFFGAETF